MTSSWFVRSWHHSLTFILQSAPCLATPHCCWRSRNLKAIQSKCLSKCFIAQESLITACHHKQLPPSPTNRHLLINIPQYAPHVQFTSLKYFEEKWERRGSYSGWPPKNKVPLLLLFSCRAHGYHFLRGTGRVWTTTIFNPWHHTPNYKLTRGEWSLLVVNDDLRCVGQVFLIQIITRRGN